MMDRVQNSDSTEFVEAESLRTNYLGFNTEQEPFDDVKVRQAIDFALDREELKEGIYNGQAAIPNSLVSASVFGHDEELPEVARIWSKHRRFLLNPLMLMDLMPRSG
ncbi:ABC transporter substrate-binding protein [Jeotgalicoccus sp. WY2]|uniref:ABC transporter substrate-binding protein n=1 Tax=Jeotgalicoccus sp. WY2 TaxID=2708346 RepID=UPI001BD68AB9|nr:ABC transporter substrate-binding protein [Jeotgalicoccus sp. WY2]